MTVVEKAAYLKGLTEGLGIDPQSTEGKLWAALNDLLADMAHEIEDLQDSGLGHAEALDALAEELSDLEEAVFDLDDAEDFEDDEDAGPRPDCAGCCPRLADEEEDAEDDPEPSYDGVIYDATCPVCGEEISFDEETLEEGSIRCPNCGELLEFDLGEDAGTDEEPEE